MRPISCGIQASSVVSGFAVASLALPPVCGIKLIPVCREGLYWASGIQPRYVNVYNDKAGRRVRGGGHLNNGLVLLFASGMGSLPGVIDD